MYRHVPRSLPIFSSGRFSLSRPLRANGVAPYKSGMHFSQGSYQAAPNPLEQDAGDDGARSNGNDSEPNFRSTILKMMETAATTFASIAVLGYVALAASHAALHRLLTISQCRGLLVPPVLQVSDFGKDGKCL